MESNELRALLLHYTQDDIVSALQKAKAFDVWTENSPIPFARFSRGGIIEKANEALCKFLKLPESEIVGKPFAHFSQEPLLSLDLAEVESVIDGKKDDYIFGKTYKDGNQKFTFAVIHPIGFRNPQNEFDHFWSLIIPTDQAGLEEIQKRMWGRVILPPELSTSQKKNSLLSLMSFVSKYRAETVGAAGTIAAIVYTVYKIIFVEGS